MKHMVVGLGVLACLGCDNAEKGKPATQGEESTAGTKGGGDGAKTPQGAAKDPRSMTAEEFMNQPLHPDAPSQKSADYPAKKDDRCNFAPMRPNGFPEMGRTTQMAPPDRITRQFMSMAAKKNAAVDEWEAALKKAGFKTKVYEPQSRFSRNGDKELLAVRGPDVLRGNVPQMGEMPVSAAIFDYMQMRHNMEFLVADVEGMELLGVDLKGKDGLDVAYGVLSKHAVLDKKQLREVTADMKKNEDKTLETVASAGMDIAKSWEEQKSKYKAFLKANGVEGTQSGAQVFRINKDFLLRFFPPAALSQNWAPKNKSHRVFVVDFENDGC